VGDSDDCRGERLAAHGLHGAAGLRRAADDPGYVYEAASVDGSTEWKSFWRITLPLLRPILALVLGDHGDRIVPGLRHVAVTTKGGPGNASRVMQYYIYQKGFTEGQFGYASALSVILFIILAAVALIQLRILRAGESDLA
jgi:multiple sugar transport system permease protein